MPIMDALPDMKRDLKFFPVKNENPQKLTAEQIHQFNEKGYIFPVDVFTEEEVMANRAYFDRIMGMAKAAGLNSYSINGTRQCPRNRIATFDKFQGSAGWTVCPGRDSWGDKAPLITSTPTRRPPTA